MCVPVEICGPIGFLFLERYKSGVFGPGKERSKTILTKLDDEKGGSMTCLMTRAVFLAGIPRKKTDPMVWVSNTSDDSLAIWKGEYNVSNISDCVCMWPG